MIGPENGPLFSGALRSAREHGASLKADEPILDREPVSNGVRLRMAKCESRFSFSNMPGNNSFTASPIWATA
jgi:hypothetical protein